MPIVCLCNNFNTQQIQGAFDALGHELPERPTLNEIYGFYRDVYEWCGVEYHQEEGRRPKCHACFAEFIDMAIANFLHEHCPHGEALLKQVEPLTARQIKQLYTAVK